MKNDLKTTAENLCQKIEESLNSGDLYNSTSRQLIRDLLAHQSVLESQNTQLIQSEKELIRDREYYNDIFNNQPSGLYRIRVFSIDKWEGKSWTSSDKPPYEMEIASDRFCEILGITRKAFIKNPFIISDLVYNDDKESFAEINIKSNKNLIPFRWEGRLLVHSDIIWVRLESMPRLLENGDILWTGILYDMTDRKKTEDALNEMRSRLEEVLEGANVGTLEWNIQTGKAKFNDIWAKNLGYTQSEIKFGQRIWGKNGWKMITHPKDVVFAQKMLEKHFSGELPHYAVEVRMRHKKGHWVWIRQEGKVKTWTSDGKPLLMYGTHTNISQRKEAEVALNKLNEELEKRVAIRTAELLKLNSELKLTEQKFRTISDFTHDWEYWRSPENKIIYMSPSVEEITGYSMYDFEKSPGLIDRIVYKNDLEIWETHKRNRGFLSPNENSKELIFRIVKKNGDLIWVGHVSRNIIVDGKDLGIRVSNRDITDKINAENELFNVTLAVEERERNRFSSELHDGMGPLLSTIKLYFQWLSDTDDIEKKKLITEKGNQCIEAAIQTARELARGLSSQLLDKLGFINAIQDFTQRINDTSKIRINFKTNTNKRFNKFLEIALYRITTELLKNTLTYAEASAVEISFNYDQKKNKINFYYSDNGVGFDSDKTMQSYKGLGIMNIQQRVQILKGKINIESSPGEGLKTFIQFPVEESNDIILN